MAFFENRGNKDHFEAEPLIFNQEEGNVYSVSIDDKTYKVRYTKNNEPEIVLGAAKPQSKESSVAPDIEDKSGTIINAPLGGNIFKVELDSGDTANEEDAVIILEAMKMETAIKPPHAGKIKKIFVSQGDKVNPGDPLFEIV